MAKVDRGESLENFNNEFETGPFFKSEFKGSTALERQELKKCHKWLCDWPQLFLLVKQKGGSAYNDHISMLESLKSSVKQLKEDFGVRRPTTNEEFLTAHFMLVTFDNFLDKFNQRDANPGMDCWRIYVFLVKFFSINRVCFKRNVVLVVGQKFYKFQYHLRLLRLSR